MTDDQESAGRDLAYGHESHRDLNDRLSARHDAAPAALSRKGPWIAHEVMARLPLTGRDFDLSRDPYTRMQILDSEGRGPKRQEDTSGRGSVMVGKDKPNPKPPPPKDTGRAVDREKFRNNWLAEQRDAVLARADSRQGKSGDAPAPVRKCREPSR